MPHRLFSLLTLGLLVSVVGGRADTLTLQTPRPSATSGPGYLNTIAGSTDTLVRADQATSDQSANGALLIGQTNNSTPFRGYFSFNLSSIPQGAVINSVSLTLVVAQQDTSGSGNIRSLPLNLQAATPVAGNLSGGQYDPSKVNFNTQPTLGSILSTLNVTSGANGAGGSTGPQVFPSSSDFISALQAALATQNQIVYFGLKANNEGADNLRRLVFFSSNENNVVDHPALIIDYTPVPEPATYLSGLAAGVLGLLHLSKRHRAQRLPT